MSQNEMDAYRELIRENIRYDDYAILTVKLVRDTGQLETF